MDRLGDSHIPLSLSHLLTSSPPHFQVHWNVSTRWRPRPPSTSSLCSRPPSCAAEWIHPPAPRQASHHRPRRSTSRRRLTPFHVGPCCTWCRATAISNRRLPTSRFS